MTRWLKLVFLVTGLMLVAGLSAAEAHGGMAGHPAVPSTSASGGSVAPPSPDLAAPSAKTRDLRAVASGEVAAVPGDRGDGCCAADAACGACPCPGTCLPLLATASTQLRVAERLDPDGLPDDVIRQPGEGPAPPPPRR